MKSLKLSKRHKPSLTLSCNWYRSFLHHVFSRLVLKCFICINACVETCGYQLCHYDVVVAQLVVTCLNKSVLAGPIGKCDVWRNDTQTPRPSTPPHTRSVMYGPIVGIKHSPLGGKCWVDGSKTSRVLKLMWTESNRVTYVCGETWLPAVPLQCHTGSAGSHVSQQTCGTWFDSVRIGLSALLVLLASTWQFLPRRLCLIPTIGPSITNVYVGEC